MKRMIIDTSNLLFRIHAVKEKEIGTPEEKAGMSLHIGINSLWGHFKKHRPDHLVLAFEGGNNWRKKYTASEACVSGKGYKANRIHDSSKELFYQLIGDFQNILKQHTSITCLSGDTLEGDDVIARYAQRCSEAGDEVIIISGDKDFIQLLKYPGVRLFDTDKGKERVHEDPEYFMFEKCFRGDSGDNVMSAYPRVRSTRLIKAYHDEFEFLQLIKEEWSIKDPDTGTEKKFVVEDLFNENKILMDLEAQPEDIRKKIDEAIDECLATQNKYSNFHFMGFCGRHGLKEIAKNSTYYTDMFAINQRLAKRLTGEAPEKKIPLPSPTASIIQFD